MVAYWGNEHGTIQPSSEMYHFPHPGRIMFFLKHGLIVKGKRYEHLFAYVDWFYHTPDVTKFFYGKPLEVWCKNLYQNSGHANFIPVQRIRSKFVQIQTRLHGKDVYVVSCRSKAIGI